MIPRRDVRPWWSDTVYQVRTDRPWWWCLMVLPLLPCWCITHDPAECTATWRLHPDEW